MSWATELYKTYEANYTGQLGDDSPPPISHDIIKIQVEVCIDADGNFASARVLADEECRTLVPVTESSAGRSSAVAPHPLSDSLSYLGMDFSTYQQKKNDIKKSQEKNEAYMEALLQWRNYEKSHPKIKAIYAYLSNGTLVSDLVRSGIVGLDEQKHLNGQKVAGNEYEKVMVRFKVFQPESLLFEGTWEDASLVANYIAYYNAQLCASGEKDTCEFSGEETVITWNHPKGVLQTAYGAKLVSANDRIGFTYRGRFDEPKKALALSYEASQKIHNALKWLLKRQGIRIAGNRYYVCWAINGKILPDPCNPFALLEEVCASGEEYRIKLRQFLNGYRTAFDDYEGIHVIGLEAATTGRLSVVYYNQFAAKDFFDRLELWGEGCRWYFGPNYVNTPTFYQIATRAFGHQMGESISLDDRILREQMQRLMDAMLNRQPVPRDIVRALYEKASTPLAYTATNRWRVLSTACAVINKNRSMENKEGEKDNMTLDSENRNRSYLFGRLLAVYEKLERVTYDQNEKRDTNAVRLQAAYVNHPMQSWKILENQVRPYFQKLSPGSREYYKNLIGEIVSLFEDVSNKEWMNQTLDEEYLLGYYLQRRELSKGKQSTTTETEEE